MDDKLDFSLPTQKSRITATSKLVIILLFILVILVLLNSTALFQRRQKLNNQGVSLSANKVKELATKLANRNLYARAAAVWREYLAIGNVPDSQRAKALYQIGILMEKADNYEEAIEYFYRSEMTCTLSELESQINIHIKDCFEKLGQFSALRYELMDRTGFQKDNSAGNKIVAQIGAEKITKADLDAMIERTIDNQLAPMTAFMTKDQCNKQKKKILEQYKNPSAKLEFLQSWLNQEVLYRQAIEEKLSQQPETKAIIKEVVRSVLSQQLMNKELADKINITEIDLQTYYQAHKDLYLEPAAAHISHILVSDRHQADNLIKRIKNGEDFDTLAKEFSTDQNTKESNGVIDADVKKGDNVPGIGEYAELNKQIFAAQPNELLAEPFQTDKGWEIIKLREKLPQRQKSFDQARQEVITALLNQKRQEVQSDLIKKMTDKFNVIIHTSVFKSAEHQGESGTSASTPDKK